MSPVYFFNKPHIVSADSTCFAGGDKFCGNCRSQQIIQIRKIFTFCAAFHYKVGIICFRAFRRKKYENGFIPEMYNIQQIKICKIHITLQVLIEVYFCNNQTELPPGLIWGLIPRLIFDFFVRPPTPVFKMFSRRDLTAPTPNLPEFQ